MIGVVYTRDVHKLALPLARRLEKLQFRVILSEDIAILEEELGNLNVDLAILHCHTLDRARNFDRIKRITHEIKKRNPASLILISYTPGVSAHYKTKHLQGYECDRFVPENMLFFYTLPAELKSGDRESLLSAISSAFKQ